MAAANRRFPLEGWFFILMGAFQRKRRREKQGTHKFWVQEIFQKREFRYFAVGEDKSVGFQLQCNGKCRRKHRKWTVVRIQHKRIIGLTDLMRPDTYAKLSDK